MLSDFERVEVLSQSFPFIQQYMGHIVVIKYGGSAMKNVHLEEKVIKDILFLSSIGLRPVLVHGGGNLINSWLRKINIEPKFSDGVRVTDSDTMEVVEMVLLGKVNQNLVSLINKNNGKAIGLSGKDAKLITAKAISTSDLNLVGRVKSVNSRIIHILIKEGYIPVIASVAASEEGKTYNINADTVAGAIAESLQASKLILLTDTPGIMQNQDDPSKVFKCLNTNQVEKLKQSKIISGGMIPKVDCCIQALHNGVSSAHIIDGRLQHSLLLEMLTDEGTGSTLIS